MATTAYYCFLPQVRQYAKAVQPGYEGTFTLYLNTVFEGEKAWVLQGLFFTLVVKPVFVCVCMCQPKGSSQRVSCGRAALAGFER